MMNGAALFATLLVVLLAGSTGAVQLNIQSWANTSLCDSFPPPFYRVASTGMCVQTTDPVSLTTVYQNITVSGQQWTAMSYSDAACSALLQTTMGTIGSCSTLATPASMLVVIVPDTTTALISSAIYTGSTCGGGTAVPTLTEVEQVGRCHSEVDPVTGLLHSGVLTYSGTNWAEQLYSDAGCTSATTEIQGTFQSCSPHSAGTSAIASLVSQLSFVRFATATASATASCTGTAADSTVVTLNVCFAKSTYYAMVTTTDAAWTETDYFDSACTYPIGQTTGTFGGCSAVGTSSFFVTAATLFIQAQAVGITATVQSFASCAATTSAPLSSTTLTVNSCTAAATGGLYQMLQLWGTTWLLGMYSDVNCNAPAAPTQSGNVGQCSLVYSASGAATAFLVVVQPTATQVVHYEHFLGGSPCSGLPDSMGFGEVGHCIVDGSLYSLMTISEMTWMKMYYTDSACTAVASEEMLSGTLGPRNCTTQLVVSTTAAAVVVQQLSVDAYAGATSCSSSSAAAAAVSHSLLSLNSCVASAAGWTYQMSTATGQLWQTTTFADSSCTTAISQRFGFVGACSTFPGESDYVSFYSPLSVILLQIEPSMLPAGMSTTVMLYGVLPVTDGLGCYANGVFQSLVASIDSSHGSCVITLPASLTSGQTATVSLVSASLSYPNAVISVPVSDICGVVKYGSAHYDSVVHAPGYDNGVFLAADPACLCPPGTYQSGMGPCLPCAAGMYTSTAGATKCLNCPTGKDTGGATGASSIGQCQCKPNYRPRVAGSSDCVMCGVGLSCPGGSTYTVQETYWLANVSTAAVVACSASGAHKNPCLGAMANGTNVCATGFTGVQCSVCSNGTVLLGTTCVNCVEKGGRTIAFLVLAAIALSLVMYQLRLSMSVAHLNDEAWSKLMSLMRMFVNHLQTIWIIGRIRASWSRPVQIMFLIFGQSALVVNNQVINCGLGWSYYQRLTFILLIPAILVAIAFALQMFRMVWQQKAREHAFVDWEHMSLQLLWIVHPMITLELIQSFRCTNSIGGNTYLAVDMSINCNDQAYVAATTICALYLTFYIGVGGFLFYGRVVQLGRSGELFNSSNASMRKYAFFVRGYRKENYLWEVWIYFKKCAIIAVMSFAEVNVTLAWTSVFVTIFGYLHLINKPHASELVNRLEIVAILTQYVTLVFGFNFSLAQRGQIVFATLFVMIINLFTVWLLISAISRRFRGFLVWFNTLLPARFRLDEGDEGQFVSFNDKGFDGNGGGDSSAAAAGGGGADLEDQTGNATAQ